jgi:glycosyltransferase involved in cell wall biosynthesis
MAGKKVSYNHNMSKIAIDARFYGTGHTGLGRYTTNVLKYLPKHLKDHELQILLRGDEYEGFSAEKNVEKIRADIPHYSFAEQVQLPLLLKKLKPDLFYTFHFNVPMLSKIPKVVTVHDLIKSHFTGPDTTTRSREVYALKRAGYNKVIKYTLTHAEAIIVPTNTVKNDILITFPELKPERIRPIKEAPDEIFRAKAAAVTTLDLPKKYLLFVGNAYPHKNLKVLLQAFKAISDPELNLVIVAKRTPFLDRTLAPYDPSRITVYSELTDLELVAVYKQAKILITPSLMEGYGLVGLEALMVGTPVIASNIPVYREVYEDQVTFFNPHDAQELKTTIESVLSQKRPHSLVVKRTWDDVARSIAEVIHERCTRL